MTAGGAIMASQGLVVVQIEEGDGGQDLFGESGEALVCEDGEMVLKILGKRQMRSCNFGEEANEYLYPAKTKQIVYSLIADVLVSHV